MPMFVEFEAFHSIQTLDDTQRLRKNAGAMMQNVMQSGKLIHGGFLADQRGGFLLVNASSAEEIFDLFAPWLHDHCKLRVTPYLEAAKFPELMQKLGPRDIA